MKQLQVFKSRTKENIEKEKLKIDSLIESFIASRGDEIIFHLSDITEHCTKCNCSKGWARKVIHVMLKRVEAFRVYLPNERMANYQLSPVFIKEPHRFSPATKERMIMSYMSNSAVMSRMIRAASTTSQHAA